eukprot:gene9411-1619_t
MRIKLENNQPDYDEGIYNVASDISRGFEQEHMDRDLTADKRIKKNVENHNDHKGYKGLADGYRMHIKALQSK